MKLVQKNKEKRLASSGSVYTARYGHIHALGDDGELVCRIPIVLDHRTDWDGEQKEITCGNCLRQLKVLAQDRTPKILIDKRHLSKRDEYLQEHEDEDVKKVLPDVWIGTEIDDECRDVARVLAGQEISEERDRHIFERIRKNLGGKK